MLIFEAVTAEAVADALASQLGLSLFPRALLLSRHDWRWMAELPDGRIVLLAPTATAAARLLRERRLLAALAPRVTFAVQRPIGEVEAPLDLRARAPGLTGVEWRWRTLFDPAWAATFADDMGRFLAELHGAFSSNEASRLAADPASLPWPMPAARLREHLRFLPPPLGRAAGHAVDRYERLAENDHDRVLAHGDFGSHNFAFDAATHRLTGVFDFEEFALQDRHSDFKYLLAHGEAVLRDVAAAYEARAGVSLSLPRIRLYHAVTALSFVAWRIENPAAPGAGLPQAHWWLALALTTCGNA
ncbi:MAG: aminoglycoside phosphotransferase family protein [Myxococcales bacterium]|nr:aminoglycoside phosphotransferase family protein [Myxococcales bacterium]